MKRRLFLQALGVSPALPALASHAAPALRSYSPGRIDNEYSLFLPGEEAALQKVPEIRSITRGAVDIAVDGETETITAGKFVEGWQLVTTLRMNGTWTAVLEKTVTHQGVIVYVTEAEGVILRVPKQVGRLSSIRPRQVNTPHGVRFLRRAPFAPGPDVPGDYLLNSNEDPCYENVAALGDEYTGYSLLSAEGAGPVDSLFLTADGSSRQLAKQPESQWAPDLAGSFFDPSGLLPGEEPSLYNYVPGYGKRTLLNGYLPVAHTGVWNPHSQAGYEVIVVLPRSENASPVAMLRATIPASMAAGMQSTPSLRQGPDGTYFVERYWKTTPEMFWEAVAGVANYWQHLFQDSMAVEIPDRWLLDAARAGISLSRCSYRGLAPTYQVGEGAYTKIPERSHALFPVAHYEFIWAHQLWNLTRVSDPYFQHYLDHYVLPNGDFLYNTQDQVEAPLNIGVVLWNSARAFDYTGDVPALQKRLPVLRRVLDFAMERYEYGKKAFPPEDRRHGLIWGAPEADLGAPDNDFPNSHPLYYQNSVWIWRGLREHSRCLTLAGNRLQDTGMISEAAHWEQVAAEMRELFQRSLDATLSAASPALRRAGITPFSPDDIHRDPKALSSYENHRFMMDWFTADWGVPALDRGHLKHRQLAGQQVMGLHTDGAVSRTSNFMEHGTLAALIREDDYRPFLLTLYSLCCYAADSGNRYSPEDACLPGGFPGEGNPYQWSSVVNSVLQPAMGLRWLLCYEESNSDVCHLQKAAPKHWFRRDATIGVTNCPTRFGSLTWKTVTVTNSSWDVTIETPNGFTGDLIIHIHPLNGQLLRQSSEGRVDENRITLDRKSFDSRRHLLLHVSS